MVKPTARRKAAKAAVSEKKKRTKKDPNKPKGAMSAYLMFCQATRAEVKAADPELKMMEISKVLGGRWKGLGDAQKKPFEDMAREMAAYKAKSTGGETCAGDVDNEKGDQDEEVQEEEEND
ncbi:unnamed protein product [Discosporangium mesarthrocarpum]